MACCCVSPVLCSVNHLIPVFGRRAASGANGELLGCRQANPLEAHKPEDLDSAGTAEWARDPRLLPGTHGYTRWD